MAHRTLRISRRKLLQLSSLAPLAALLARGATAQEINAKIASIPDPALTELWKRAEVHNTNLKEEDFKGAVKVLWLYLEAGAEAAGFPVPETQKEALALIAWDQPSHSKGPSGELIADATANWAPEEHPTNGCAYLCGFYVAEAAKVLERGFDKDAYAIGYKRTEKQMTATLKRLNSDKQQSSAGRGAGCG